MSPIRKFALKIKCYSRQINYEKLASIDQSLPFLFYLVNKLKLKAVNSLQPQFSKPVPSHTEQNIRAEFRLVL